MEEPAMDSRQPTDERTGVADDGHADAGTETETPPNLSRVQVYLYGLLALFLGVVVTSFAREAELLTADRSLLLWTAAGTLVGGFVAALVVGLVVRQVRALPSETRYRLARGHTLALTVAVVGFLALVTVEPSLVTPAPPTDGLRPVDVRNIATVLPLVAALATVAVLGYVRRRGLSGD